MLATLVLLLDRRTGWAGISTGLLMLTRPSAQLLLVALGAWIAWRLGWREAVRYAVVAVAVVMPWIARNWAAVGGPVLVTSNGFNLAATYSREALVVGDLVDPVFDAPFAPLRVGVADEATLDAAFRDYALASLRERPLGVIQVTARNALRLFEIKPSENIGAEFLDGRSIKARTLTLPLVQLGLAGGALAMVALRRRPGAAPLLLTVAVLTMPSLLTIPAPRLRAPFDLAACVALGTLVQRKPALWRRRLPAARKRVDQAIEHEPRARWPQGPREEHDHVCPRSP